MDAADGRGTEGLGVAALTLGDLLVGGRRLRWLGYVAEHPLDMLRSQVPESEAAEVRHEVGVDVLLVAAQGGRPDAGVTLGIEPRP
ncbi:hypothetical protein N505_0102135 [Rhodococcus aetherivorans]|nr:hypothetical protein N505_0102135 [Rhodococcus aetherivorans]